MPNYAIEYTYRDGYRERELAAAQLLGYLPIRRAVDRPSRPPRDERTTLLVRLARLIRHDNSKPKAGQVTVYTG